MEKDRQRFLKRCLERIEKGRTFVVFENGKLPPDKFIPIAEEIGLIHSLGNLVLKQACQQIQSLRLSDESNESLILSVEAQGYFFSEPICFDQVQAFITQSTINLPPAFDELPIISTLQ